MAAEKKGRTKIQLTLIAFASPTRTPSRYLEAHFGRERVVLFLIQLVLDPQRLQLCSASVKASNFHTTPPYRHVSHAAGPRVPLSAG